MLGGERSLQVNISKTKWILWNAERGIDGCSLVDQHHVLTNLWIRVKSNADT